MQRLVASNPVSATRRRDTGKRIPYLFDLTDAKRLLEAAGTLPDRSRAPHRARTYETLFALLYGLGLRAGEAVRLKLGDVDFHRDALFIHETKFSKSRIVPLGPKLAARLRHYVEERHGEMRGAETPLFSFTKRGCICPETVSQTFHALVPKLGLAVPPGVSSPRLHDLRHVFRHSSAVHLLEAGVEVNVIRAWLGHVSLDTTNRYAEITLRTKQAAVAVCTPLVDLSAERRPAGGWRTDPDLLKWLDSL